MTRFEEWLQEAGIEVEVRRFPAGTRTAEDAARAIGCEVAQIVKSLVFEAGGRPVLTLVSGSNRLDPARLARIAGSPVDKAPAQVVRAATGYSIGSVPPFGHMTEMPIYMDRDLLQHPTVWAAAGRSDSVFPVGPQRLCELSGAVVAELKVSE